MLLRLANDLAVVSGHFQELGDSHLTLIAFLSLVDCDNTFSLFLFAYNNLVRHLLQFALADLVAELLTPTASAATPRSCQPASGLPRYSACTLLVAFIDFHAKNVGSKEAYVCECISLID